MKFKKNIKNKFRVGLLLLIVISISILAYNPVTKNIIKLDSLAYLNNSTYEEKPLSEAVNTMYVTMIDNQSKVVATTNPNIEVDNDYKFSNDKKPNKQPNIEDTYTILYELVDTNDENGYAMMEEDVIYTLELPDYIEPQEIYEESITQKCTEFVKKGKSIACGGIYKENDKYIFKVKFKDILNKKDVKVNYQYSIKINNKIEDIIYNVKSLDFTLPGAIQLFMEREVVIPPVQNNYDVKIISNGWTSITNNYAKWTVTITDNHTDGYRINGSLYVDFGPYMAMAVETRNYYQYMEAYADGTKFKKIRNGNYSELLQNNSQTDWDGDAIVSPVNRENPKFPNGYSWSASQFKIDIGKIHDNELLNENVEGIHEWKFEFITKEYSNKPTTFNAQVRFIDNNDIETLYQASDSIEYSIQSKSLNTSLEEKNKNNYNIAETLTYTTTINNNSSNVLKIKSNPSYSNGLGLYYYLDNLGFTAMYNKLSGSIKVKINGRNIEFTKNGWNPSSMVNGQVSKADPLLQKVLENNNLFNGYTESSGNSSYIGYFKSNETNEDGDYYWIVLSQETANKVENLYNGLFDYVNINNSSYQMPKPAQWEFTLLNAKGSNIEIKWDENLFFYDRVGERVSDYSNYDYNNRINNFGSALLSEIHVNEARITNGYSPTSGPLTPLRVKGEVLNNNYIKWEMKINTNYMHTNLKDINNYYKQLNELAVYLKIPNDQFITNGYYNPKTNSIVDTSSSDTIDTNVISYCIDGDYNQYDYSNYDTFTCTKYEAGSSLSFGQISYTTPYNNTSELIHLNRINDSSSNNMYSAVLSPKSIKRLQGDQNGEIRLIFFTKDQYISSAEKTLYANVVGISTRKPYGRTSYLNNTPVPVFSITNKATLPKTKTTKYYNASTIIDNKIESYWMVHFNNTTNGYYLSSTYEEKGLSYNCEPDVFNGRIQFKDVYATSTEVERIIAQNSKVKAVDIYYDNSYDKYYRYYYSQPTINYGSQIFLKLDLDSMTQDEEGYYKICHNDYTDSCLKLRYNYGK